MCFKDPNLLLTRSPANWDPAWEANGKIYHDDGGIYGFFDVRNDASVGSGYNDDKDYQSIGTWYRWCLTFNDRQCYLMIVDPVVRFLFSNIVQFISLYLR